MPYYIGGVTAEATDLVVRTPAEFLEKNRVMVKTRHRVELIEHENRRVRVRDLAGDTEFWAPYTRLLISTGADAFVPPIEGAGLDGVFTLRKLKDSIEIMRFLEREKPRRAAIVGAGPIGMEMCEAFRRLGIDTTVIELAPQVMPSIDGRLASLVQAAIEKEGVTCSLVSRVEAVAADSHGRLAAVSTTTGEVEADIVLLAIGIRPSVGLAAEAGVELGARGAIRVDEAMRTSIDGIFAAGDCATTTNRVSGGETWIPLGSNARKQGRVAGETMFGGDSSFPGVVGTSIVKVFDKTVGRTGLSVGEATDSGFDPVEVEMEAWTHHDYYHAGGAINLQVIAERGSGVMLGAQLVGDWDATADRRLDVFAMALTARITAADLQYVDLAYAPPYSTATDIPIIAGNLATGKLGGPGCSCDSNGLE
jgi:NADPH-dependent 2,4-dienoyl-CoA reductase/sulfur reductase-like enzyme